MVYLILLCALIAVPAIVAAVSFAVGGFVVGSVGTMLVGIFRLFGKKEPLPHNPDIFPIIPEEEE